MGFLKKIKNIVREEVKKAGQEVVEKEAYNQFLRREAEGIPGNSYTDWHNANEKVSDEVSKVILSFADDSCVTVVREKERDLIMNTAERIKKEVVIDDVDDDDDEDVQNKGLFGKLLDILDDSKSTVEDAIINAGNYVERKRERVIETLVATVEVAKEKKDSYIEKALEKAEDAIDTASDVLGVVKEALNEQEETEYVFLEDGDSIFYCLGIFKDGDIVFEAPSIKESDLSFEYKMSNGKATLKIMYKNSKGLFVKFPDEKLAFKLIIGKNKKSKNYKLLEGKSLVEKINYDLKK